MERVGAEREIDEGAVLQVLRRDGVLASPGEPLEVLTFLHHLVRLETGRFDLSTGLTELCDRMGADEPIQYLGRWILQTAREGSEGGNGDALATGVREFVRWYARRRDMITLTGGGLHTTAVFPLRISHDQRWSGTRGAVVECALSLAGRLDETVWLQLTAECDGQALCTRAGWESWRDGTDPSRAPFAAFVPIRSRAHRLFIDDVRIFVPYGALDHDGEGEISLRLSVISQDGRLLAEEVVPTTMPRPPGESPVMAPATMLLWEQDSASGCALEELHIELTEGEPEPVIHVACDLLTRSARVREWTLQCLLYDGAGRQMLTDEVKVTSLLPVHRARCHFELDDVGCLRGPVPGVVELLLLGAAGRIVCGTRRTLPEIPARPSAGIDAPSSAPRAAA